MKRCIGKLAAIVGVLLAMLVAVLLVSAWREGDLSALYSSERAIRQGGGGKVRMDYDHTLADGELRSHMNAVGIYGVWCWEGTGRVTFTADLEVASGRAKLVYVEEGRELITLAEVAEGTAGCTVTLDTHAPAAIRLVCDGILTLRMEATQGELSIP